METFKLVTTIILMIAYSGFSIWAVTRFKKLSTGIAGSLCLAAGSVGIYFAAPFVAAIILWILNAILIIGALVVLINILGG